METVICFNVGLSYNWQPPQQTWRRVNLQHTWICFDDNVARHLEAETLLLLLLLLAGGWLHIVPFVVLLLAAVVQVILQTTCVTHNFR